MEDNSKSVKEPSAQGSETVNSDKEFNFRKLETKFQKQLEEKERENLEMRDELDSVKGTLNKFQSAFSNTTADEEYEYLSDSDATKLSSKLEKSLEEKIEQRILARMQQEKLKSLPNQLRERYQDFDEVLTDDAVSELEKEDPWFSKLAAMNKDNPHAQQVIWEGLYNKVKSKKAAQSLPTKSPLQERMERNKKASLLSVIGNVSFGMPNAYEFDVNDPEAVARARESLQRAKRAGGFK